jgi:hypothetical protein
MSVADPAPEDLGLELLALERLGEGTPEDPQVLVVTSTEQRRRSPSAPRIPDGTIGGP